MVKDALFGRACFRVLPVCAIVLCLAAWLRGAEYDEQYTLFLTAGMPRPDWPDAVFPAGLARMLQAGQSDFARIGRDLRVTDVHPPLYFWAVSLWRSVTHEGLFAARLFSVLCVLGALALAGVIARSRGIHAGWTMALTLGCYGFTYTGAVARGFALAQLLVLGGIACVSATPKPWRFGLAGLLFGAATLTNYLAVFVAGAALLTVTGEAARGRLPWRPALAVCAGFALLLPADLWWFLAQRASRDGQFPPFAWTSGLSKLARDGAGAVLGGLPLYVDPGFPRTSLSIALGSLLLLLAVKVTLSRPPLLLALAAMAPAVGLMGLGLVFNTTPIELRYLAFATPFVALLLARALPSYWAGAVLAVQAASLAGLMLAPQTMQPARAAARFAAAQVREGVVVLPRGNDGVGVVGAFAIESPPALPLLLIAANETPEAIRARLAGQIRVVTVMLEQDEASRTASAAMRLALAHRDWREVARQGEITVYERTGEDDFATGPSPRPLFPSGPTGDTHEQHR